MKNHWLDKKKEKEAEAAFGKIVVGCDPCIDFNSTVSSSQQVSISGSQLIKCLTIILSSHVQCPQAEWTYTITS